jgi:hypothetical protein
MCHHGKIALLAENIQERIIAIMSSGFQKPVGFL